MLTEAGITDFAATGGKNMVRRVCCHYGFADAAGSLAACCCQCSRMGSVPAAPLLLPLRQAAMAAAVRLAHCRATCPLWLQEFLRLKGFENAVIQAANRALEEWREEAHKGGRPAGWVLSGAGGAPMRRPCKGPCMRAAGTSPLQCRPPHRLTCPAAAAAPLPRAVAETMVQMECDYVTPSFFRELEKEYQSGLRRRVLPMCGLFCWCGVASRRPCARLCRGLGCQELHGCCRMLSPSLRCGRPACLQRGRWAGGRRGPQRPHGAAAARWVLGVISLGWAVAPTLPCCCKGQHWRRVGLGWGLLCSAHLDAPAGPRWPQGWRPQRAPTCCACGASLCAGNLQHSEGDSDDDSEAPESSPATARSAISRETSPPVGGTCRGGAEGTAHAAMR